MINIIKDLYNLKPHLIGTQFDNALKYLDHLIGLDIIEIPSGTRFETWEVPEEWVAKEAWVKYNGKKIIDFAKDPLSLMVYSRPFKGKVSKEELKAHLYHSTDMKDAYPYVFSFYEKKWGVCMPWNKAFDKDGKDKLKDGEYEVFINTEFKPSKLKIGVHTIKGKSDREILLFAHLDHPYQANDNLSGVACLTDLAPRLKEKYDHTIKIIFCPETIGSIAYAFSQDISKVDFVIALDCVGNDNVPTVQWSYNPTERINRIVDLATMSGDESYNMNRFRATIGSDEYVFNDPLVDIPGVLITRYPYKEYHTSADTPEIIKEDKLKAIQDIVKKTIDIYEKDYIPVKKFKGPLMRSRFNAQSPVKQVNLQMDYLIYGLNSKSYLSEILTQYELNWQYSYDLLEKLHKEGLIEKKYENNRTNARKGKKRATKK